MLGRKAQNKDCQTLIKLKIEREELADILMEGGDEYQEYKEEIEEIDEVEEVDKEGTEEKEEVSFEGLIETEKDKERAFILKDKVRKERIIYKVVRMVELSKGLHTNTIKEFTTKFASPYTKQSYKDLLQHVGSNIPMMSDIRIVELAEFLSSEDAGSDIEAGYEGAVAKSQ